jgi:hypothetical protein
MPKRKHTIEPQSIDCLSNTGPLHLARKRPKADRIKRHRRRCPQESHIPEAGLSLKSRTGVSAPTFFCATSQATAVFSSPS